jgi:hypothetical protein
MTRRFTYVLLISAASLFASHAKELPVITVTSKPTGRLITSVPQWELYSDGSVSIRRYDGTKRRKSIDPANVATLLKKLDKLGLYRITSQSVEASIEKFTTKTTRASQGAAAEVERIVITDCNLSTISVRHAGKPHTVTYYAVEEMAEHYPKATDLVILKKALSEFYKTVGDDA